MKKEEIDKVLAEVSDFSKKIDALLCGDSVRFELQREVHSLKEIKVACILDEFSFINYAPECNLEYLRYETWHKQMMSFKPDIFFMETAWQGLELDWEGKISTSSKELMGIIHYCRSHNIPIVMWNKEDPVHTKKFLPIMKLGDFVFTTAAECIDFYKKELGHDRVGLLHFAAQPKYHNPIETFERKDAIAFAGAFYPRFPQRNEFLWDFIQNVENNYKVEIYDRNYYVQGTANKFPDNWKKYIMGNLSFDQIAKGYKGYKYNISLNSVTESETMFSRRVFELMASNTLVLSNFSKGMNNLFGDLVLNAENGTNLSKLLLAQDEGALKKRQLRALRCVMSSHLYEDRFSTIIEAIYGKKLIFPFPIIYVYSEGNHPDISKQTYKGIIIKKIGDELPQDKDAFISIFSKEYSYDEDYLYDLILSTRYSDYNGYMKANCPDIAYHEINYMPLKNGIVKISEINDGNSVDENTIVDGSFLAIDEYGINSADDSVIAYEPFTNEGNGINRCESYPTVSVIIPTYKDNPLIHHAIKSILAQDYPQDRITIVIGVNGGNLEYYNNLLSKYKYNSNIIVLFTKEKSAAAGRNIGIDYVESECTMFLDDDDYFTLGYISSLMEYYKEDVSIVIGKMNDLRDGVIVNDTYMNRAISRLGEGINHSIYEMTSIFATVWGKLYSSKLLKKFKRMDVSLPNTEDVIFWTDNICDIEGDIYIANPLINDSYIRRVTMNSLSRPKDDYKFYVDDRLEIIARIEPRIYEENIEVQYKRFFINQLKSQLDFLKKYYDKCEETKKGDIREKIRNSKLLFFNYSLFGAQKGIAFCHNFTPYIDASAYVASKRLKQISDDFGEYISWDIISAKMNNVREIDNLWNMFFAQYQYTKNSLVGDKSYWNEKSQIAWGKKAFETVGTEKYDVIYSRSMWVGSHIAALLYKEKNPSALWYAEFSDPIYMGTDSQVRKVCAADETDIDENFYKNIEINVLKNADIIIFTNSNQKKYMLDKNEELQEYDSKRLCVWNHPVIDRKYASIITSDVVLDKNKINIGYFGTFYANRNHGEMLKFLDDDRIAIYLFTNISEDLEKLKLEYKNLSIHNMVPSLEALNIMSKMDYCFLNDIEFVDTPNPYLPSKLADYLVAANKIIALIRNGSPLSEMQDARIVKTYEINSKFISTLEKQVF